MLAITYVIVALAVSLQLVIIIYLILDAGGRDRL